jgi:hypothetical protein
VIAAVLGENHTMVSAATSNYDDLIAAAEAIVPRLTANAAASERARCLAPDSVAAMQEGWTAASADARPLWRAALDDMGERRAAHELILQSLRPPPGFA